MPTVAPYRLKPEFGQYIYKKIQKLQDAEYAKGHKLSDASIARRVDMIPETLRRLYKPIPEGEEAPRITFGNAVKLIILFDDDHIADLLEYDEGYDKDSLVIASYGERLKGNQKLAAERMLALMKQFPDKTVLEIAEMMSNTP